MYHTTEKLFLLIAALFLAGNVFADEILESFEEENIPVLRESIRKIRKGDVELATMRDNDGLTKIQIEESADENIIRFDVEVSNAAVEQLTIQDGKIEPTTDNDIDLGASTKEYKNLYIDGTAYIDALQLSTGVTATEIENNDSLGTSDVKLCTQGNVKAYVDVRCPVGTIQMYGGSSAPTGWLSCDGSAVSRTTYVTLFGVISTTYGVGDGSTTFNLPNFTSKFARGNTPGTGGGSDTHNHGGTTGSHTLTISEMPAHTHTVQTYFGGAGGSRVPYGMDDTTAATTPATSSTGGGGGHTHTISSADNIPTYTAVMYIIKH